MSSYHELMVRQINADRNRSAGVQLDVAAAREVSSADVREFCLRQDEDASERRRAYVRNVLDGWLEVCSSWASDVPIQLRSYPVPHSRSGRNRT